MIYVEERLHPVVAKLQHLGDNDLRELDEFIDYLLDSPGKPSSRSEKQTARMYDFMNGGLERERPREPEQ